MPTEIKRIAISSGDPYGIGPEVITKALERLNDDSNNKNIAWVIFGPKNSFDFAAALRPSLIHQTDIKHLSKSGFYLVDTNSNMQKLEFDPSKIGQCTADGGWFAKIAIDLAIESCMSQVSSAIVTAPISKEAMQLTAQNILGHTEYLAKKTNTDHVVMALVKENLRVALQSIHIPLKSVPSYVNSELLHKNVVVISEALIHQFGITKPKIALLGLNPHAGEAGHIGNEEVEIIEPFIKNYPQNEVELYGPFAADGYFGSAAFQSYDATLAMYHDQGLVGFKSLAFGGGVNTTFGLPFVRTSPDHGTAYAIAGQNKANEGSMMEALQLAATMVTK